MSNLTKVRSTCCVFHRTVNSFGDIFLSFVYQLDRGMLLHNELTVKLRRPIISTVWQCVIGCEPSITYLD